MTENSSNSICRKCHISLDSIVGLNGHIGRTESCPSCMADLHSCIQCKHYDSNAYNECRESQAERVVDKERSNFCDYFALASGSATGPSNVKDQKKAAIDALDDLFK